MKTAVSLPERTFVAAERLAKERGLTRSELYRMAIEAYLEQHGRKWITEALNRVYADGGPPLDPAIEVGQRETWARVEWED
jgi:predicted DNA-binding protein